MYLRKHSKGEEYFWRPLPEGAERSLLSPHTSVEELVVWERNPEAGAPCLLRHHRDGGVETQRIVDTASTGTKCTHCEKVNECSVCMCAGTYLLLVV